MIRLRALERSSFGSSRRGDSDSPPRTGIGTQIYRGARNSIQSLTPFRNVKLRNQVDTTVTDDEVGDRMIKDDDVYDLSNQQRELFNTTTPHGSSEAQDFQDVFNQTESVIKNLYRNVSVRQKIHDTEIDHNQEDNEWEPTSLRTTGPGSMVNSEDNNVSSQDPPPGGEFKTSFRNDQRLRNRDDNEDDDCETRKRKTTSMRMVTTTTTTTTTTAAATKQVQTRFQHRCIRNLRSRTEAMEETIYN